MMILRLLLLNLSCLFSILVSYGQLTASHSTMSSMSVCDTQPGSITFTKTGGFTTLDTVFFVLPSTPAVSYSNFTQTSGTLVQSNDTLFVFGLPSSTPFTITYSTTFNCAAINDNSVNFSSSFSYSLNSGSWTSQPINNYPVNSPYLNYLGGFQLNFGNAQLGFGTTRSFYYTNTNSNEPFTGFVEFRDTLPHDLSYSSVTFDTVYLASANGNVLTYDITDSTVRIVVELIDFLEGDTLEISNVAFLNDCVVLQNNVTKFELNYGCVEADLCQTVTSVVTPFKTTLNFDPNDKPSLTLLNPDIHHEACYFDTVIRTEMFRNDGPGIASGILFEITDRNNEFGLTFLDTSQISVYLNSISPSSELIYSSTTYTSPNQMNHNLTVNENISVNDTIIIVYREINKCIDSSEYDYYYNRPISMHDISLTTDLLHPCIDITAAFSGIDGESHQYKLNQQFNNLTGTVSDFEENWFEIDNIGDFTIGGGPSYTGGIGYDLTNSQLEVEFLIESGLSLVSPDSLFFCSTFSGVTSYLPLENLGIFYGPLGPDQFDTIRAKFSFPSNFQAPNPGGTGNPPAHYPYKKTSEFYQFFANSSIKFKLKAYCDSVASDSKAIIHENVFFVIDTNCINCKLPLASVEDEINILCPGCILPGWNLTQMDVSRKNIGYEDTNNNHYPDGFPLQVANISDVNSQSVIIGDTLEFAIEGFISDGDSAVGYAFNNIGFIYDEGQFLFRGSVDKLEFIGGTGVFIEGNVSTPFYIPSSAATVYSDSAIGIDMSIASLNNVYGVTSLTNYNDSCSIVFNPQFKVIANYDDGQGVNPYFDLKNITTFYFMGGNPFGAPDILQDANVTPISSIDTMTSAERENLAYWCVGFEGRFIGVGVDFYEGGVEFDNTSNASDAPYNDCIYRMTEYIAGMVGDEFVLGAAGNGPDGSVNAAQYAPFVFENELRNLYNIDSIKFSYPPTLEAFEVQMYSHSFYLDTIGTFSSKWSPINGLITNNSSQFTNTPTSVTIYPEQFIHMNTDLVSGNNHLTYDENVYLNPTIYLRNKDCPIDSVIPMPVTTLTIENYISDFPGATNGDTVITLLMSYGKVGSPGTNEFFQPDPQFNVATSQIPVTTYGNIGYEIDLYLDVTLPANNTTYYINSNINVARNTFMVFESPNGNFTNIIVPNIDNVTTSFYNNTSSSSSITPIPATLGGDPYIELGTLGGAAQISQSRLIDLFATHDCSSIPPGGIDSLYLIYGWNCFGYPDTLENACFVDTFVLYITTPDAGLSVLYGIQDSISLCDTIHFSADFNAVGEGEVTNIIVEILNQNVQAINYVTGSGLLTYNSNSYILDPTVTGSSHQWILDSLTTVLQGYNGLSPNALFTADLLTACGLSEDTLFIRMSGSNNCGQIIFEDTFELTPQTFYDLPTLDSLELSGNSDPFVACDDTNTVSINVTNLSTSASNIYNEVQVIIPSGYQYISGGTPIYNSNDTLILSVNTSIASSGSELISIQVAKVDSTCDDVNLTAQLILKSPYYCDTNECFYTSLQSEIISIPLEFNPSGLELLTIDPAAICSGINEITIDYSSLGSGSLEVYNANTNLLLGQETYPNTNGSQGQFTISLSDSSSNLFFVNTSPCCPDTIYYAFNCDTICQADASFELSNYCLGDTIYVSSSSPFGTHTWTYSYFGLTSSDSIAAFPAAQAGTFSIQHIFNADCGVSDTVVQTFTVNSPAMSSIVLNGTNPICFPDSVELSIQNGTNYTGFVWTTGEITPTIWVSASGTYGVTILDTNGCSDDCQAISITSYKAPDTVNDTIYICQATENVTLDAGVHPFVTWNNGSTSQFNTVVGPGVYTAEICEASGICCETSTFTVIFTGFTFDIPDTVACDSDSTLIVAPITANSYLWSNGNTGSSTYFLEDGTHWLTATNDFGCMFTDTFTIISSVLPLSNFTITDTICTSDSITCFYPEFTDPSFAHQWVFDFGGSQYTNFNESPCFIFSNAGTFPITHIATNACGSDTTIQWITVVQFNTTFSLSIIGQNPFCTGDSVQLTSSGNFASIEWNDANGNYIGSTNTVTVYTGGVFAATMTDSNGCTFTSLINVSTVPTPVITLGTVTNPTACASLTGSIEVTGSGSGNISWSGTSSGSANSVTLPYVITGLSAGTYDVTLTTNNGCVSNTLTATLSDPALPNVIASGSTTICLGQSTTISASGATTYSWDNGAGANAITSVSPTSTTVYTVTGSTNGCYDSDQVIITVIVGSSSTQNISLCPGQSVTVGANTYNSAGTYIDAIAVQGGCDSIVTTNVTMLMNSEYMQTVEICKESSFTVLENTYTDPGTYVDITTNAAGCDSIITTELIVLPNPSVNITPVDTICLPSGAITLIGNPPGGIFTGPGVSGSSFQPEIAGVGSHLISYTYTDTNGCEGSSSVIIVVEKCEEVGIDGIGLDGVTLFPNPNEGYFIVNGLTIGTEYTIYDIRGRLIATGIVRSDDEEVVLKDVQKGIYFLYATQNDVRGSLKFLIIN